MILRFIADDFTGASDVLLQCRKGGMDAAIVSNLTIDARDDSFDGIATTARAMTTDELTATLPELLDDSLRPGTDVLLYKVCSTFDSSPTIGSIGYTVKLILEHETTEGPVIVVPAQPAFGRFTVFGNHFAASGENVYRLDHHPVMSTHPSTPMAESDLRALLEEQGIDSNRIAHLPLIELRANPGRLAELVSDSSALDAVVVDALDDSDLDLVAHQILTIAANRRSVVPVVGSGGIAGALSRANSGNSVVEPRSFEPGPTLVLSGSRSPVTKAQIEQALAAGWGHIELDGRSLISGHGSVWADDVVEKLRTDGHVIVSLAEDDAAGEPIDPAALAEASGVYFADLIRAVVKDVPGSRLAVLGGDTSSWTVSTLQPSRIQVVAEFVQAGPILSIDAPGIPADTPFLLKGGQVGGPDTLISFAHI